MTRLPLFVAAAAASLGVASPAMAQSAGHILRGAAIGAGGGAVVGAIVPGLSVGEGAAIGAIGGATINALDKGHRHHYRYRHGRGYWVDRHGYRHYR
jgi:hypothetical protein